MKNPFQLLARELLAEELVELGEVLDAFESARVPICPTTYRKSASMALQILGKYPRCPYILDAMALSPSLIELRSTLALSQAIEMCMYELPLPVRACLRPVPTRKR